MHHVLFVPTCPPLPETLACELRGVRGDGRRVSAFKLPAVPGDGRRAESEDPSEAVEDLPIWPEADIPGM